ncbi:MAG: CoA-binding protein [Verrucomicrobiota bacterium]|jgi:hypothetical protein
MHSVDEPSPLTSDDQLRSLLAGIRVIAVVGLSANPERDSHHVAAYLQQHGYCIIPVNPKVAEVLGEKAYASLRDVPERVDMVDVFRQPATVPEIVADAIAIQAGAIWLQEGVVHEAAAATARAAGLPVIMDRCLLKEHRRLGL